MRRTKARPLGPTTGDGTGAFGAAAGRDYAACDWGRYVLRHPIEEAELSSGDIGARRRAHRLASFGSSSRAEAAHRRRCGATCHDGFVSHFAFEGLVPAEDTTGVEGVVGGLREPPGVGFRVPTGFDSIARIHHPLADGRRLSELPSGVVGNMESEEIGDATDAEEGCLDAKILDRLVPLLSVATSTPSETHFGLWVGWGELRSGSSTVAYSSGLRGRPWSALSSRRARSMIARAHTAELRPVEAFIDRCARLDWWGGPEMLLFDGPVDAVQAIGTPTPLSGAASGSLCRRSPQWWWPSDRAWFLSSEIDDKWTYVAGPTALTEAVLHLDLDAVIVAHHDTW